MTYAVAGQGEVTEFGFHFALSQFLTLRVKVRERETEIYSSYITCDPAEPERHAHTSERSSVSIRNTSV